MHLPTLAGPRRRTRRAILAAALPAALAAFALPTTAQAASVSESVGTGEQFVFVQDRGFFSGGTVEDNNVSVGVEGGFLVIRDTAGITTEHQSSRGTCVRVTSIEARCPRSTNKLHVSLGAGADLLEYRAPQEGFVDLGVENDRLFAGRRLASGLLIGGVTYSGGAGFDTVSYARADRAVRVDLDGAAFDDGRLGDRESIGADVEIVEGSNFDDTLIGSDRNEHFRGLNGNDLIAGNAGDDILDEGSAANGADTLGGGPGSDHVFYGIRTSGVNVSLDNVRNDGAVGEQDNVGGSVDHISGSDFRDTLIGDEDANRISAHGGADSIQGLEGADTLFAGAGANGIVAGTGNDVIEARNGEIDNIDCGESPNDSDTANRDADENRVIGCERGSVGVLRLAPTKVDAEAGDAARMRLSWRHPKAWKQLKTIELRLLTREGLAVGEVTIRTRGKRIAADGAVRLARERSRLTHNGKAVAARLALQLGDSLAGQELTAEVEATDTRGRRQLERNAGTVRVAG